KSFAILRRALTLHCTHLHQLLLPKNRRKGRLVLGPSRSGANLQLLLRNSPPSPSQRRWRLDGGKQPALPEEQEENDEEDRPLRSEQQKRNLQSRPAIPSPKGLPAKYDASMFSMPFGMFPDASAQ